MPSFALLAIKSTNTDQILESVSQYYSQHGLDLCEAVIGDRESQYQTRSYQDLEEFRAIEHRFNRDRQKRTYNTHFEFYFNLEENFDWSAFYYDHAAYQAHLQININQELASYLSKKIDTTVIEYFYNDTTTFTLLRSHKNGKKIDELYTDNGNFIQHGRGFFEKFDSQGFQSRIQLQEEVLEPYFEKHDFHPNSADFNYYRPQNWRHFYLKGSEDDLKTFLQDKQKSF